MRRQNYNCIVSPRRLIELLSLYGFATCDNNFSFPQANGSYVTMNSKPLCFRKWPTAEIDFKPGKLLAQKFAELPRAPLRRYSGRRFAAKSRRSQLHFNIVISSWCNFMVVVEQPLVKGDNEFNFAAPFPPRSGFVRLARQSGRAKKPRAL